MRVRCWPGSLRPPSTQIGDGDLLRDQPLSNQSRHFRPTHSRRQQTRKTQKSQLRDEPLLLKDMLKNFTRRAQRSSFVGNTISPETLKKDWRSLTWCFLLGVGADVNTASVHNAVNGQGRRRLVSIDTQVKTSLSIFRRKKMTHGSRLWNNFSHWQSRYLFSNLLISGAIPFLKF